MKPVLITIVVFQIEAAWNGFLRPLMITTSDSLRPLQLGLAILAQKRFVEGMANVGIED